MAMNKRDYQRAGIEHARNVSDPTRLQGTEMYPRSNKSWQARAFWEGYDSHTMDKARAACYDKILDGGTITGRLSSIVAMNFSDAESRVMSSMQQFIGEGSPTGRIVDSAEQNQRVLNTTLDQQRVILPGRQHGKSVFAQQHFMAMLATGARQVPEHWPEGAKAHGRDLARQYLEEVKQETDVNQRRMRRLTRAVQRLYTRHTRKVSNDFVYVWADEAGPFNPKAHKNFTE